MSEVSSLRAIITRAPIDQNRCIQSQRQCDGYVVQRALIFDPDASRRDRRCFQFLREQAHGLLEVHNEEDFVLWNHLMLQASHRNEAIRHGVLALSAYAESLNNPSDAISSIIEARKYYFGSLSAASAPSALHQLASIDEILLLGLLLHCVELFRQQYAEARVHLHAVINIVSAMTPGEISRSLLAQIVRRLRKSPNLKIDAVSLAASASMPIFSIESARDRLMQIHSWISRRLYASCHGQEDLQTLCAGFQLQLYDFKVSLDDFDINANIQSTIDLRNLTYIRLMHALTALAVSVVALDGSDNPSFLLAAQSGHLRKCLELCKAFAFSASRTLQEFKKELYTPREVHFGFDTELILIILFLASSSTEYILRQEAITLLRSAHRREGSWDSFHAAHIIECLMQRRSEELNILGVSYYYSKSITNPVEHSYDFTSPDTVSVQYGSSDETTSSQLWFRCTCNRHTLCQSTTPPENDSKVDLKKPDYEPDMLPAYEQTEFTPSLITQIFIAARYRYGVIPTHEGSSAIAVRQHKSLPVRLR